MYFISFKLNSKFKNIYTVLTFSNTGKDEKSNDSVILSNLNSLLLTFIIKK